MYSPGLLSSCEKLFRPPRHDRRMAQLPAMNRLVTALLVILLLPLAPVQAAPQTPVPAGPIISGVVRDSTGRVIAGASVTVRVPATPERRTTTDAEGRFSVPRPSQGDVTLIVR